MTMEQTVKVCKTFSDGTAQVLRLRESACSGDCHKCSGCGAPQQKFILTVNNPIGVAVGDMVIIQAQSAHILKAAAIVYLLPLILFFAGYALAGIAGGGAGFFLGVLTMVLYGRKKMKKEKTVYTITGFAA